MESQPRDPGVKRLEPILNAKWEEPSWELARTCSGMMRASSWAVARVNVERPMVPTIAKRMNVVVAKNHAECDWTVLAKDALGK